MRMNMQLKYLKHPVGRQYTSEERQQSSRTEFLTFSAVSPDELAVHFPAVFAEHVVVEHVVDA